MVKFALPSGAGLGDDVVLTALIRAYKAAYPTEIVHPVTPRQEELFRHNPLVGSGTTDNKIVWSLHPMLNERLGNLAVSYAQQVKIPIVDTTPEVFLSPEEEAWPFEHGVHSGRGPLIAIDQGASWPSRRWPYFKALATTLREHGAAVVELGYCAEEKETDDRHRLPAAVQLFNRTSLREAAAVLKLCDLFVGNDSGLMHLAAAVGTPQVVFYSVKPWYARAYWNTTPVHAMRICAPACKEWCAMKEFCLAEVTVERVAGVVEMALGRFRKH